MLTRGAAGPPDVHIPTRLVTSGPLLLSLQNTQVHTYTGFLQQTIHSTHTTHAATQNWKASRHAVASVDLLRNTTMRILFTRC